MAHTFALPGSAFLAGALLLTAFTATDLIAAEPKAQRVGVAAAVKPDATSQPPGGAMKTLKLGKSMVYNERIDTSGAGVVQVLLVDGSTFTVGPGSSLVIDKFVYDPKTGKGDLVATFGKGALRFVGGKLSKDADGITVKTPAGALTVRGGIFQGIVQGPGKATFAFVFGEYLMLKRGGQVHTIKVPGMLFSIGNGGPLIRKGTQADANRILAAVSGKPFKTQVVKAKGQAYHKYRGFQPTGWGDQPFVQGLYYDGITGDAIRGMKPVPMPQVVVAPPPPVVVPQLPPTFNSGPCTNVNC